MKRFPIVLLLPIVMIACKTNKKATIVEKINVTVEQVLKNPLSYVDKEVVVNGTVSHVCRKDGKKMFIFGINPDSTLKITTGPNLTAFDVALEGTDIEITGVVKELRIDESYVAQMEADLLKGAREMEPVGQEQAVGQNQHEELSNINVLREEINASGKGYISEYRIENVQLKKKEETKK